VKKKSFAVSSYSHYLGPKEWVVIESCLKDLEDNQDIKLTTIPKYAPGYLVKKLQDESLIKGR